MRYTQKYLEESKIATLGQAPIRWLVGKPAAIATAEVVRGLVPDKDRPHAAGFAGQEDLTAKRTKNYWIRTTENIARKIEGWKPKAPDEEEKPATLTKPEVPTVNPTPFSRGGGKADAPTYNINVSPTMTNVGGNTNVKTGSTTVTNSLSIRSRRR